MPALRLLSLSLALAAAGLAAGAEDLKPALTALPEFLALDGSPAAAIAPGQPFRLRVTLTTPYDEGPPAGVQLMGWLRRIDPSNLPCQEAAESFLRSGRLPVGAVFLNDPVIGVATTEGAFLVSDPEFSLASANILGAQHFDSPPAALAVDDGARRFLLALPDEGRVVGIDGTGAIVLDRTGLAAPLEVAAAPQGAVALRDGTGAVLLVAADGAVTRIAEGVTALHPAGDPRWLVTLGQGAAMLHDLSGGTVAARADLPGLADAAALTDAGAPPFALALLSDRGVQLRYLDAPDAPALDIALPSPATRLAAGPGGRVLLAWSPAGGPVHVIDVARARLVRSVGAAAPISEVAFSDRSAFLMLASQTHVGALDILAVARGEPAEFREIPIGSAAPLPLPGGRQLLAPLRPLAGVLAVHAETFQGYRIMDSDMMGDAPAMTATPLRGGVPLRVAALDRSFRATGGGPFETVATLPGPGRFELVATTGLGALSFCAEVPVANPVAPEPPTPGRLSLVPEGAAVRLRLTGPDGGPAAGVSGSVTFAALVGSWRSSTALHTDGEGRSTLAFRLPEDTDLLIRVTVSGGPAFEPFLLEAGP